MMRVYEGTETRLSHDDPSEPKECPFCGSDSVGIMRVPPGRNFVRCLNCHAQGPISFDATGDWNKPWVGEFQSQLATANKRLALIKESCEIHAAWKHLEGSHSMAIKHARGLLSIVNGELDE